MGQLVALFRPSISFLFLGLQVSSSLPPPGRLPFRSWLQPVISFSCIYALGSFRGDLDPIYIAIHRFAPRNASCLGSFLTP